MDCAWKPNWEETKANFRAWWKRAGMILGAWAPPIAGPPHEETADPGPPASLKQRYTDPVWRAQSNHYQLSRAHYPADVLADANCDIGPGSLALLLGSPPGFAPDTVWYFPTIEKEPEPEKLPPLRFDPDNKWWQIHETTLKECARLGKGKYAVGCPDLIENTDILASLRGAQTMLVDMLERPEWVERKVAEINQAWFEAYRRVYEIIKLSDGSSIFGAFSLWGPGKTAKLQCDSSAMFSPKMFDRFVVPALTEQCRWLDNSLFHLDGTDCLCHLDSLLGIEELDVIEWTPEYKAASGGSPAWYPLYRRILAAGKCVQAVGVRPEEVIPLLDACGAKGMYILTDFSREAEIEELLKRAAAYR